MSWKDLLQLASFRGVPFQVDGSEANYGRKAVLHEYPLRDKPYVEDMGRKARGFTLEGFVIGANYIAKRDELTAALEQFGPGSLVHPYLGEMTISVTEFKVRESTAEGGMARFTITCVESGELSFPTLQSDTAAQADAAAAAAIAASQDDFANKFNVLGFPEFVANAVADHVDTAVAMIDSLRASVPSVVSVAPILAASARELRNSLVKLMQRPADLGTSITELIVGLAQVANAPFDALKIVRGMYGFGSDTPSVPTTTPSRIAQANSQAAVTDLVQRVAVAQACSVAAHLPFDNNKDAVALRDGLADQLDTLAESASDDSVYQSLMTLRAAMVRDITARGADLARTVTITPQATLPALVLAYELYEDATREADIVTRNKIRHPGFVPGGRPLEVLADA